VEHPPETIAAGPVTLTRWVPDDVEAMHAVITANIEHLRPWMPWIQFEPLTIEQRRELLVGWHELQWESGEGYNYAIRLDGEIVGSCGLMARIDPGGLEIGYWVAAAHNGKGFATAAAGALTEAGLALPQCTQVEIHHDKANVASGRVPEKLGYALVGEGPDGISAPAESGIGLVWRTPTAAS
jgi:ribosomal-protein-serine acetyltransferase